MPITACQFGHPRVAMQILRHSRVAITMEIYTEVPSAATREALRRLGPVARGHRDMSVVAALAAALTAMRGQLQDRNWPLSWARSEGLEPPTF